MGWVVEITKDSAFDDYCAWCCRNGKKDRADKNVFIREINKLISSLSEKRSEGEEEKSRKRKFVLPSLEIVEQIFKELIKQLIVFGMLKLFNILDSVQVPSRILYICKYLIIKGTSRMSRMSRIVFMFYKIHIYIELNEANENCGNSKKSKNPGHPGQDFNNQQLIKKISWTEPGRMLDARKV